jgi:ribosomal protein S18 acetylase RimI-like enzyme
MVSLTVRPAPPDRRQDALALLASAGDDARLADTAEVGVAGDDGPELPLDGLLIAEAGRELLGAVLYVVQAGGVAFVWPPAVRTGEPLQEIGLRLLNEVTRRIDAVDCRIAQALIDSDSPAAVLLEQAGFPRLTELLYLERPLDCPMPAMSDTDLKTVTYDPARNQARFADLLEATYAGTLDCPELNGVRTTNEALAGHRAAGQFEPRLWKLYHTAGQDVGLMLAVEHPAMCAREIVYMGVAPEARSRGVGGKMLADALREAQAAGRERVLLAVDIRNSSARRLYDRQGFTALCRRAVHLRVRR